MVDDVVRLGVVGDDGLFLVLLGLDGFLGLGLLVLVLLCQFVVLLLVLSLTDGGQTGFLSLQFCHDGLQGLGGGSLAVVEHLLHQWVV